MVTNTEIPIYGKNAECNDFNGNLIERRKSRQTGIQSTLVFRTKLKLVTLDIDFNVDKSLFIILKTALRIHLKFYMNAYIRPTL